MLCQLKSHFESLPTCSRSMHKLTQLERLDLGNNEFSELPKCRNWNQIPEGKWAQEAKAEWECAGEWNGMEWNGMEWNGIE
ncbi:hypothetical protein EK904_014923 [Melospiza melodia maxima]|nr:hypothetical protein EK904_014923 [Melospiza melodia maxima]